MSRTTSPTLEKPIQAKGLVGFVQRTVRSFREMMSDIFYLMVL